MTTARKALKQLLCYVSAVAGKASSLTARTRFHCSHNCTGEAVLETGSSRLAFKATDLSTGITQI